MVESGLLTSRARIALAVCAAWMIVAVAATGQSMIGAALMPPRNAAALPLPRVLRAALVQTLPWIPVSFAAIALAVRFPLNRRTWRRYALLHVVAAVGLGFVANVLTVATVWLVTGRFKGAGALFITGARWMTIRLDLAALAYLAILTITEIVLAQRRARHRELKLAQMETQLARAQLQALNAQIRPHFLFNTLHTIGQLWRSGRSDEADAVLDHLGALFNKVQASTSRATIPLGDELAIVREYIAIEQSRYGDRLRAEITAPDEVLDCAVPPLILQPIVENAVRHGIAALSTAGRLVIRADRVGDALRLVVRDDGPGPNGSSKQAGSGMGIRNTKERLQRMYGPNGSFDIGDNGGTGAGRGTTVSIHIPLSPEGSEVSP